MTTTLQAPASLRAASDRSHLMTVVTVVGWITCVLLLDAHSSLGQQDALGIATWCVLLVLLARESALVRAQTLVVVTFASAVEYTFSPLLHVYLYRFHNVPLYVPPGHGLVYLAALSIGRMAFVRAHARMLMALVILVGGTWSAYGVLWASRPDALGAFWFVCLVGFLLWGPSRGLYIGAFLVVSYLELLGTSLGTWTWQPHDPTGIVSIGNPPSGAPGGYGWFDLAALLVGPRLVALRNAGVILRDRVAARSD
ncbi:MAG: hypothetical protein ACRDPG_12865 [Nocardioidaceae bacterium]